jgi:hypothetical protein
MESSDRTAAVDWISAVVRPGSHWVLISVCLYVAACFLPAMPPIFGTDPILGWVCLTSLMVGIPAWWANPAYFLALILIWCRRPWAATVLAGIAALLACSFQLMDIQNHGWAIQGQEIGCYVWIASMQILACNLAWQQWLAWRASESIQK